MTFLKALGRYIVEGLQILAGIQPIIQQNQPGASATVTKVVSDLQQLANIIVTVEAIGTSLGLPGTDKIRGAGPLVAQLILQSELMVGKQVANGPAFSAAAQTIAGGFADLLNSLSSATIQIGSPAPVPTLVLPNAPA